MTPEMAATRNRLAWATVWAMAVMIGCSPGDTNSSLQAPFVGAKPPDVASIALPCPAGMTAQQCADLNNAIQNLKSHGSLECQWAGSQFELQMDDDNVDYTEQTGIYGASPHDGVNWDGTTLITVANWMPQYWVSGGDQVLELQNTIAHEVYGHQTASSPSDGESIANYYGTLCSGGA